MTITIIPAAPPPHIASFAICLLAESKKQNSVGSSQ
jgi:hypothetical protein